MSDSDGREIETKEPWREIFAPDCGTLLDIRVYGTSDEDYRALLAMMVSRFGARYMRDGIELDAPAYEQIRHDYQLVSVYVKIFISDVQVNLWFWSEDEIELDLLPDDVNSAGKAEGMFRFISDVSKLLSKRVLLTAEHASGDQEWAETHCLLRAEPSNGDLEFRYQDEDWSRH